MLLCFSIAEDALLVVYIGNGSNISVSSHKSEFTVGSSISVVFPYGKHPSYTSMKQNCQVSKKRKNCQIESLKKMSDR